MGLELRQAFTELRLEPREVELIQLAQISLVRRVDRIEPIHEHTRAPRSPLPISTVTKRSRSESFLTHRRLADLRRCDPDHHEVVADLLQTATVRTAMTGRPGARLLRGAALRACHGCDVRSGHATRK